MKKYKHEKVKVFFTILPIHTPFFFLIDFHRFFLQFKVVVDILANSVIVSEALKFTKIVEKSVTHYL